MSRIKTIYRRSQTLMGFSGRFVSVNPMQQRKGIQDVEDFSHPPVQPLPVTSDREIQRAIANCLDFLPPGKSVFVIGRTLSDVYAPGYGSGAFTFSLGDRGQLGIVEVTYRTQDEDAREQRNVRSVRFLTTYSLNGLEVDNVFLTADRDCRGGGDSRTPCPTTSSTRSRRGTGVS